MQPESLDVVVASNLFGDILTDLGGAIQGSLGFAASANINPAGGVPSMFEPVHGSAPAIAGPGIANPIATIWSRALMLQHLGESGAASAILTGIECVTGELRIQSLMMAFGMVVIAGIVGSGGLGETIYGSIRTLDIATSINAAIAIVILTMVVDRLTQSAVDGAKETDR